MKILRIQGENIASLPVFDVDFRVDPLRSAGLFAIVGPTGSGKSTILDAMCLALYQKAPRLDGISGQDARISGAFGEIPQDNIRNLLRRGSSAGWASCTFQACDGRVYTGRWGYRLPKRKGAALQEELTLQREEDGQLLVTGNNRKGEYGELVAGLVGLSWGQFTRTVLLAQGRFAEFLKASDGDRARLLEALTGTEVFASISRVVYRRHREEEATVREIELRRRALAIPSIEEIARLNEEWHEAERSLEPQRSRRDALARKVNLAQRYEDLWKRSRELQERLAKVRARVALVAGNRSHAEKSLQDLESLLLETEPSLAQAERLDEALGHHEREVRAARDDLGRVEGQLRERADLHDAAHRNLLELEAELSRLAEFRRSRARLEPVAADWPRLRGWLERLGRLEKEVEELSRTLEKLADQSAEWEDSLVESGRRIDELRVSLGGRDSKGLEESLLEARQDGDRQVRSRERNLLSTELQGISRRLDDEGMRRSRIDDQAGKALAVLEACRELVDQARARVGKDVEAMRSRLRPGTPCPVCGSESHPLQGSAPGPLQDLLAQQESILAERLDEWTRLRTEQGVILERLAHLGERSAELAVRLEAYADLRNEPVVSDEEGTIRVEQSRVRIQELEDALKRARRLDDLSARQAEVRAKQEGLKREMAGILRRSEQDREEIALLQGHLDRGFDGATWRERREAAGEMYLDRLDAQISEWADATERWRKLDGTLDSERSRVSELQVSVDLLATDLERCRKRESEAGRIWEDVRRERSLLLDGRPVSEERARRTRELDSARKAVLEAGSEHDVLNRELSAEEREAGVISEEMTSILRDLSLDLHLLADSEGSLAPWFDSWHREWEQATSTLESLLTSKASLAERLSRVNEMLDLDAQLQDSLARSVDLRDAWARLASEVGAADGKKFCVIAQRFTLQHLLELADRELSVLAPRYSLRRLGEGMSIGVLDRHSWEEIRPVHTLSGGETFLVSLALALGLSRLSGSAVEVATLFIDEGFGTLDSRTLRQVMDALSHLQSQGRQVGLVTHVEELKELVPVRLEVSVVAPGASIVRVS